MDIDKDILAMIKKIHDMKDDYHKKHCPELIDGIKVLSKNEPKTTCHNSKTKSKDYEQLLKAQRSIIHKNDFDSQKEKEYLFNKRRESIDNKTNTENVGQHDDYIVNLCKPWAKLPNNHKITAVLAYVEKISTLMNFSDNEKTGLRYFLISSISNKKITKSSDVEYDSTSGYIISISNLVVDKDKKFHLVDKLSDRTDMLDKLPRVLSDPKLEANQPEILPHVVPPHTAILAPISVIQEPVTNTVVDVPLPKKKLTLKKQ
jgi:hypothetical protein